ncbi:two-component sensor histidine kinase [Alicyclobacillus cellulosilyticus]|uniref:histidine kinase n=1 Tax=Alicyclobacillus cellulosilyticus TaxID=1003997 RepID=A0A917K2S9_9BACL|nr:ATP-binding protein [Alicyclobacillus cellulosilyticus]GGI97868.1 two-component sensor histidine kinase [Alicyclobacillus cellulosilyticus]
MSLRTKLFSAMVSLIVFMTVVFFALSHGYMAHLFKNYALAAREGDAEQWATLLSYYYVNNHNSWHNVDRYVAQVLDQRLSSGAVAGLEHLEILSPDRKQVIFATPSPQLDRRTFLAEGIVVPIQANGRTVGILALTDRDLQRLYHLEQRILDSMADATLAGAVATVLVALLVAFWLTRRITHPLQQLIHAIRRISEGDLGIKLAAETRDELGQVTMAFNHMAAQLAKMEQMRRHLVADVAHELRTPLTIIQGQLELIQQGVRQPEPAALLPIQDEVMRLTRLVDDLHQLSLAEAGVLPLEKRTTELVALVGRVVENFQIEAEERTIRLFMEAAVPAVYVWVDAHRMTQVFVNLVGNALRYTPAGGEVKVRVEETPQDVRVTVSDTGPGIAAEHLPHIFDRFYRVEEARSRESGGMGLGLAIAKEFVEAHRGRIEVVSRPGQGTSFIVVLPRMDTPAAGGAGS